MRQGYRVIDADTHVTPSIEHLMLYADKELRDRREELTPHIRVTKPQLLAELTKVLIDRPRMRRWIDVDVARRYVDAITTTVELVVDPTEIEMLTRDPGDDYVVALARENEADFIVTGDKDLLEWPEQRPPVVAPAAFEAVLQASIVSGTGMGL